MRYDYLRSGDTKSGATTSFSLLGVPFEVVANIPIGFLKVNGGTRSIIVDNPLKVSGKKICRLKTLGELASFGYEKLNRIIRTGYYPQKSFSQIMYEIQVALARFSMKLRGTDFTIYDIELDDLKLTDEARSYVRRLGATNLGDLYIGYKTMKKSCTMPVRDSLRGALLEFGSRPEVSGSITSSVIKKEKETLENIIRNSKSRVFPSITRFAEYSISDPLSSLDWVSGKQYSDAECDYSGLIREFVFEFLTEEELVFKTGIDEESLEKIKNGKALPIAVFAKLCTYFDKSIDDLVVFNDQSKKIINDQILSFNKITRLLAGRDNKRYNSTLDIEPEIKPAVTEPKPIQKKGKKVLEPTNLDITAYDYSPFFQKVNQISSLNEFAKKYNISQSTIKRMKMGKPVYYHIIEKLATILNCQPSDLFVVDRKKIEEECASYLKLEQGRSPDKEFDYSGLKIRLAERLMNIAQMCSILKFNPHVRTYISYGTKLSNEELSKIAEFLGCSVDEIIKPNPSFTKGEKFEQIRDIAPTASHTRIDDKFKYDYSGLFNLMKQRKVTRKNLADEALVYGYIFIYQIDKGLPISKLYMDRLCMYFDCKEEDIAKKTQEPVSMDNESYVNLKYGSGLARVKPYSPTVQTEETPISQEETHEQSGGTGSGSGNGVKSKFYMGKNGFLNQEHDIIKLHRERPMLDSELDFIERQF